MKNIIFLFIGILLLSSCDDRFDFVADLNQAPIISFDQLTEVSTIETSFKLGIKSGSQEFAFQIFTNDVDGNIVDLQFNFLSGTSTVIFQGEFVEPNTSLDISDIDNLSFSLNSITPGMDLRHIVEFTVTDNFGATSTGLINLEVFENLPPIADLTVRAARIVDNLEYQLDASGSMDQDEDFGGEISTYIFDINGIEIESRSAVINHVFSETGNFQISLTVQDNDGVVSETVTDVFTIN